MKTEPGIRRFDVPTTILRGGGARHRLPDLVREMGGSRVLLVTDPGVVQLGAVAEVVKSLKAAGVSVAIFDQVQPDPTDENVAAGVAALGTQRADLIVAFGGGSPIDVAKVIAIRPANPAPLPDFMGLHKIRRAGLPLIAVPTTAGTGSEATKVAVITDTARHVKMMMLSAPLLPRAAIVDYELSLSMPRGLTAAVGVDTLTHGIEAYVSRQANALADPPALQCVTLAARHLRAAWTEPSNRGAREGMMLAATLGGMAFSNSSVCLVHGMSRPIGAVFHLPHGLSNAILLPTVARYSVQAAPARYAAIARACGCAGPATPDADACATLITWLEDLNRALELPRLSQCRGVTREVFEASVEKMATDALASGSPGNNPRVPTATEIVALYREAWGATRLSRGDNNRTTSDLSAFPVF
ncbi:MAG: iron-containing alcohol dehydrogenase [Verrucomicrobia bacterium]|nr:iron-containing alcohol dehydrogenase [Verrucomicrobiota bacterium]